jgi:hypothetical protein
LGVGKTGFKLGGLPSAAKAVAENKALNAALEALLHPKPALHGRGYG